MLSILDLCNRENRPKYLHKGFQYGVLGEQVVRKTAVSIVQILWDFGKHVFKIIIWF